MVADGSLQRYAGWVHLVSRVVLEVLAQQGMFHDTRPTIGPNRRTAGKVSPWVQCMVASSAQPSQVKLVNSYVTVHLGTYHFAAIV
jgi:hypothetical protein